MTSVTPQKASPQQQQANGQAPQQQVVDRPLANRPKYEALAPIGSANGLKGLLEAMKDSIAQALPKHVTPERLIKTLLVAANRNPDLLQCTQASILETINRAAELGLDLSGTLGEAYPVPFNNSIKIKEPNGTERWVKVKQCTLIIGYRGLEKLAWQSEQVSMIDAEVVCENDRFIFRKGFEPVLEWTPAIGMDRGEPIGAYALIITKNGGKMARFMPKSDIEKIRGKAISGNSPAWKDHWNEMARKTALRRVMKDAPLSTEKMAKAIEHDDADYRLTDVFEAETTGLKSLPRGRSSFREQPQAGGGDQGGDDGGNITPVGEIVGEVVDDATGGAEAGDPPAPDPKPEDVAKADAAKAKIKEQAEKLKAAEAPKPVDPARERWTWKGKGNAPETHPAFYRAHLIGGAALYLSVHEDAAENHKPQDLVKRLEDGHGGGPVLPGPADDPKGKAETVKAYQEAVALMEKEPDRWASFVVPA